MNNVLNGTYQESNHDDREQSDVSFYELWFGKGATMEEDDDQLAVMSFLCACRMITSDAFLSPSLN